MSVEHELRGIREALERIAAALEAWTAAPAPANDADASCNHPFDARIDFGVTGGREDFECRECGFRSVPQET